MPGDISDGSVSDGMSGLIAYGTTQLHGKCVEAPTLEQLRVSHPHFAHSGAPHQQ